MYTFVKRELVYVRVQYYKEGLGENSLDSYY